MCASWTLVPLTAIQGATGHNTDGNERADVNAVAAWPWHEEDWGDVGHAGPRFKATASSGAPHDIVWQLLSLPSRQVLHHCDLRQRATSAAGLPSARATFPDKECTNKPSPNWMECLVAAPRGCVADHRPEPTALEHVLEVSGSEAHPRRTYPARSVHRLLTRGPSPEAPAMFLAASNATSLTLLPSLADIGSTPSSQRISGKHRVNCI